MESSEPLTRADAEALLRYAQMTYGAVTEQRRRSSRAFLVIAVFFALVALLGAVRWATISARADDVADTALIDTRLVRVPDPRPALERAELRMRAFGWALVTGGSGFIALLAAGAFVLLRPTPLPPELRALEDRSPAAGPPA